MSLSLDRRRAEQPRTDARADAASNDRARVCYVAFP